MMMSCWNITAASQRLNHSMGAARVMLRMVSFKRDIYYLCRILKICLISIHCLKAGVFSQGKWLWTYKNIVIYCDFFKIQYFKTLRIDTMI